MAMVTAGNRLFAECQVVCRVQFFEALGKGALCRVKKKHSAKPGFAECL
jgi:hypothetical protein